MIFLLRCRNFPNDGAEPEFWVVEGAVDGKIKIDQTFNTFFVSANAGIRLILPKDSPVGNPGAERQFIGNQDVRTHSVDGVFQLIPLRVSR